MGTTAEHPTPWRFFQDVVVPAVFGNTVWALLQMLLEEPFTSPLTSPTLPRAISLVVLSVFLFGDWHGGRVIPAAKSATIWFSLVTGIFYLSSAAFALSTAIAYGRSGYALLTLLVVTAIGWFGKVWAKRDAESTKERVLRWLKGAANVIAAGLLFVCWPALLGPSTAAPFTRQHFVPVAVLVVALLPWGAEKVLELRAKGRVVAR